MIVDAQDEGGLQPERRGFSCGGRLAGELIAPRVEAVPFPITRRMQAKKQWGAVIHCL